MPFQTKHLTKKQLKAKKLAEKMVGQECHMVSTDEMPKPLLEIITIARVGFINEKKDWTETAEYKKDFKKAKKNIPLNCKYNIGKMIIANQYNEEHIIMCENLAYYYRLNLEVFEPCIILTQNGKDETDYLQIFKDGVNQRWDENTGKKGELGFFYNRGDGCLSHIDNEKDLKKIADEMCSPRLFNGAPFLLLGSNVYKHNHTINGEVFYGVGLANKNDFNYFSQDRFAMSIFRHEVSGYTWYFHNEYDQQQLINRFMEQKPSLYNTGAPNYINCCSAPDTVSENDID